MKRTFTFSVLCAALCFSLGVRAQWMPLSNYPVFSQPGATISQVVDTLKTHMNSADTAEGGEEDQLLQFETFWQPRVLLNDSSGTNMFIQYMRSASRAIAARYSGGGPCSGGGYQGKWQVAGPDSMPNQTSGFVSKVWAGSGADSNLLFAGSNYQYSGLGNNATFGSGLFKSTDGGKSWNNVTDGAPVNGFLGISCIAANPLNDHTIYVGTSSAGILKSFDQGNTWQQEVINRDTFGVVQGIFFTPDSIRIYAFKFDSIFTRLNTPGSSWVNITPPTYCLWINLQFVPGSRNSFYVSNESNPAAIWAASDSVPTTGEWTDITAGFSGNIDGRYIPDSIWVKMDISMPEADTLYFIAIGRNDTAGLYKYSVSGNAISQVYPHNLPDACNRGVYWNDLNRFSFVVSPASTSNNGYRRNIYYGGIIPYHSYDGGQTFVQIGRYDGTPTHGDIRGMYLAQATNTLRGIGDRLFIADDGGVSKRPVGVDDSLRTDSATIDISGRGLSLGEYWSFDISESGGKAIGCMMHDGVVSREPMQTAPWQSVFVADAWQSTMACNNDSGYAFEGNGTYTFGKTQPGSTRDMNSLDRYFPQPVGGLQRPVATDAFGNLYCLENHFQLLTPGASAFTDLSSGVSSIGFPFGTSYIGIAIALNPNNRTFEGYTLYTSGDIYYRDSAVYGSSARLIPASSIPKSSSYPLVRIATDPNNTERVWVCQGNVCSTGQYRVQYSPDHGTTFIDISYGLPTIAVTQIVFDEAADALYCSTDAGIYKCDFSTYVSGSTFTNSDGYYQNNTAPWTCFSQGLVPPHNFPNVPVTALKIDHCEGKLYAATHCRSVWSTDLYPAGGEVPQNIVINSNITWTGNQYVAGGILIQRGAKLTLNNDTIHMPNNGAIIVSDGAQLIVNSSVITNDCSHCMWKGIEVLSIGDTQSRSNSGFVQITNNSVIQHAKAGVANYDIYNPMGWGYGGICQASNSSFIDDSVAVSFMPYLNGSHPNLSNFANVSFLWDKNFKGDAMGFPPGVLVDLNGVTGINFRACQFLNRDTAPARKLLGDGIRAINASFNTLAACPVGFACRAPSIPCYFRGFMNGIDAMGTNYSYPTLSIDQSDFDSCSIGVKVSADDNVSVTRSNFVVGHGIGYANIPGTGTMSTGCYQNVGILQQGAAQFWIEGNKFTGKSETVDYWYNYGVVVANMQVDGTVTGDNIYRNTFDSLTVGAASIGKNSTPATTWRQGLLITCDSFSYNQTAIEILTDGDVSYASHYEGIDGEQFPDGSDAGNKFTGTTNNITNNTTNSIYFCYYNLATEWPSLGATISPNIFHVTAGALNTCPATIPPLQGYITAVGGDSVSHRPEMVLVSHKQIFLSNKTAYLDTLAIYSSRLDYGNTDSMVKVVDTCRNNTVLSGILMPCTPYVSEKVLKTVTDSMRLTYPQMLGVLLQTPDDIRDPAFLSYVNSVYSFSPSDMASLVFSASTTTNRTRQETAMGLAETTLSREANTIMMMLKSAYDTSVNMNDTTGAGICTDSTSIYFLQDSNTAYVWLDSVDQWLQNIGGLGSAYSRVGYYHFMGDTTIADSIYHSISSMIPPSSDSMHNADSVDYATFGRLWKATMHAESAGRNMYTFDSAEIASLDTTSFTQLNYGTPEMMIVNTTGVISHGGGIVNVIPCLVLSIDARHSNDGGYNSPGSNSANSGAQQFSVYPNPTSGMVTFSYNAPGGGDITITVMDLLGKKVAEMNPGNTTGNTTWNAATVAAGMYIYEANNSKGIIGRGKIVVVGNQ